MAGCVRARVVQADAKFEKEVGSERWALDGGNCETAKLRNCVGKFNYVNIPRRARPRAALRI